MSLEALLDQLDPDPKKRGDQFERICAWYLENAPEYRGRFQRIWLWSEWPGAWAPDAGIDLVAEEHDGDLWAIQAKAYDPAYAIKKADVDSFLAESSRPGFTYRLLIATTDRLGPTAKRTLDAQREPVGYRLRSDLELAPIEWPSSPEDLRPRRPPPKKPFPHVREAIRATVKGFDGTDRGQLIMACGTGKTLAAMWISERLDANRTLILVPSLSLLAQTLREWSANASESFDYLAVCSDETVAGADHFVGHTAELGLPVTTDPDAIAAFLRRRGRRVIFSTYQSSPQIASAYSGRTPGFDLAIADEAHRCAGRTSNEFATILDGDRIQAKRRLFMTATPRFYTSRVRREAGQLDVDIASMDDEMVFGPVLHRLTFGEGIERNLLSDYQVVVVGVDNETYRSYAKRGEFVSRDGKDTDARTLAGQIGLAKTMRKYDLHRVISFHSRVKAAREFSAEMPQVIAWMPPQARPGGELWSEHVSGAMTSGHRDRLLLRFRNLARRERGLLSNARCLGEGVDVPTIDGVAFIDPRRSTIDIVQALGRAIRRSPEKELGTIVLPVFLSTSEDPEQVLDQSAFKHVWDVLKALRAHDEALGEELDELRRRLGARRLVPERPGKIKLDVPAGRVGAAFVRAFNVRLVERTTAAWNFYFGLLQSFVEREGHCLVPQGYIDDGGRRLGAWVSNQRHLGGTGELPEDRFRRLEGVRGWVWDTRDASWDDGYTHLLRFVRHAHHARVPQKYRDPDGYRLGMWVAGQRASHKTGSLSAERTRRLEAVSCWVWDPQDADWHDAYARVLRFSERNGHARIPQRYRDDDGYRLGTWVLEQRSAWRRGKLSEDRRQRLEVLPGWAWNARDARWDDGFERLLRFVEREGHSLVQVAHRDEDGYRLGTWVDNQRHRRDRLSGDKIRLLEALPEWVWDSGEAQWESGFSRLQRFVECKGHARVPSSHRDEDGFRLGSWVGTQRQARRRGRLPETRARRLEALPGWAWDALEAFWEANYARLVRYVQREGHSRVPNPYLDDDGFNLGGWVARQRSGGREDLSGGRVRRLEGLPDWTWDPDQVSWDENYARLLAFVEREGHSRVPLEYEGRDGYKLGSWVAQQRRAIARGSLVEERTELLEELPGWTVHPLAAAWEDGYERLERYVERVGHARVPQRFRDDEGYRLGQWVSNQRGARRRGKLSAERRKRLEALPGWVWITRRAPA